MDNAKKSRLLLSLLVILSLSVIGLSVLTLIFINQLFSSFFIVGAILLLLVILKMQNSYCIINMERKYEILQAQKASPISVNQGLISDNWINNTKINYDYVSYKRHEDYQLLYRFERESERQRPKTILILVIIFNQKINFDNLDLARDISALENSVYKKNKYRHRLIMQFKEGLAEGAELNQADKVFYLTQSRVHFVLINCLFDRKSKQLYFLHSNEFSPNQYYKRAVDEIVKLSK